MPFIDQSTPFFFVWPCLVSLLASLLIVFTQSWHGGLTVDHNHGVQKVHHSETSRIGGLAIFVGLLVVTVGFTSAFSATSASLLPPLSPLTPPPFTPHFTPLFVAMLISALPAFTAGLVEDMTHRVSPRIRLLAAMASGLLACWLTGYSLNRVDVWGVDALLAWSPIAIVFTAFSVAGVANAINMIDGLNGLASGVMMIAFLALAVIAHLAGDSAIFYICLLSAAAVLGFFVVNFPFGKLFLGDGGAYLLGFWGAWLAVMLPMRNESISVWAPLLVFSYPILETLFSILRRRRRQHDAFHPDRLHLHSLVYARRFRSLTNRRPKVLQNAFASLPLWGFMLLGSVLAVLFAHSTLALMACFAVMAVLYQLGYRSLVRFGHFLGV
jgi:UDP-N-acetylmuramyl pentapeptide phosphotransferase/UDP-N-acetylglucosamine-1-phosphate transferase